MKINCNSCGKHVGDIKAGSKLAKGIQYSCGDKCEVVAKSNIFDEELSKIRAQKSFIDGWARGKGLLDR